MFGFGRSEKVKNGREIDLQKMRDRKELGKRSGVKKKKRRLVNA